jgi:cytochrome c oxidase subunit 1
MAHSRTAETVLAVDTPLSPSFDTPFGASLRTFITVATILTIAAQALFLFNFIWTLRRGEKTDYRNPWRATSLEWSVPSPAPVDDFGAHDPVVYRGAYEFGVEGAQEDFVAQNVATSPAERASQIKQAAEASSKEN